MKKRTLLDDCYNVKLSYDSIVNNKIKYIYVKETQQDSYKRIAVSQYVDISWNELNDHKNFSILETDLYTCIVRSEPWERETSRIMRSEMRNAKRELNKLTMELHNKDIQIQCLKSEISERNEKIAKLEKEISKFQTSMWDVVKSHFKKTNPVKVMSQREQDIYNLWLKTTGL
jgi:chromosome segregation ATPase